MKTMVAIRAYGETVRFVTNVTVGNVFRQIATIVRDVQVKAYSSESISIGARIAIAARNAFEVCEGEADWHVIADCEDLRIYVGRRDGPGRDGCLVFGSPSKHIVWNEEYRL